MPAIVTIMILLAGCTVGPNFVRPTPQVPAHWSPSQATTEQADLSAWWREFNDPTLSSLIDRSVTSNLDLRAAVLRIEEARAQRDVSASAFWPRLSVDAAYSRQRISETTPTGSLLSSAGNIHLPGGGGVSIPNPYSQYQLSADASWEIDLFGRVRRSVEAADASIQVSIEDGHAVQVSLLADVAQSYMALRGAQSRLQLANENLATLGELLELTRARGAAGLTTHIDVGNAIAQESATRAELPAFELQITLNINQLSQLLAREPEALRAARSARRFAGRHGAAPTRYPSSGGQSACRDRANRRGRGGSIPALDSLGDRRLSIRRSRQAGRVGQSFRFVRTHLGTADIRSRQVEDRAPAGPAGAGCGTCLSTNRPQRFARG
jgi:outer membrane protein TolC